MKKWLSIFIAAVLLCGSAMPAYAFDYDQVRNTIYQDFMQQKWADYQAGSAELIEERPDLAQYVIQTYEEYIEYSSVNRIVEYVAEFGEGDESLWVVSEGLLDGSNYMVMGDYIVDMECTYKYSGDSQKIVDPCLLQYYADGKTVAFDQAYAEGLITEADIAEIWANGGGRYNIFRIGDATRDQRISVGDILSLKNWIVNRSPNVWYSELDEMIHDVDQNGVSDVGDIMALKSVIMKAE